MKLNASTEAILGKLQIAVVVEKAKGKAADGKSDAVIDVLVEQEGDRKAFVRLSTF